MGLVMKEYAGRINGKEAMENIMDAIKLHIEDRKAEHEDIPASRTVSVSTVGVTVGE